MKKITLLTIAIGANYFIACSQISLKDIRKQADKAIKNDKSLTEGEIIGGLKEALTVGTNNSASKASKTDGFLKNPKIRIPFPPEAQKMEQTLRQMGMNKQVDKFVLTLNRAAEEASKSAAEVFIGAIKQMTIGDGLGILKGQDNAATKYLQDKTSSPLKKKFQPIVHDALQKVEYTKYWFPLATAYNKIPFVEKMNPDIEDYTTTKALGGLFALIAEEEMKIRKDPMARVTDLLKKVFK